MWREEHLWNVSVRQRVHISNLDIAVAFLFAFYFFQPSFVPFLLLAALSLVLDILLSFQSPFLP
jgi:hypothetical protein